MYSGGGWPLLTSYSSYISGPTGTFLCERIDRAATAGGTQQVLQVGLSRYSRWDSAGTAGGTQQVQQVGLSRYSRWD
jgi:hypothetical protein